MHTERGSKYCAREGGGGGGAKVMRINYVHGEGENI